MTKYREVLRHSSLGLSQQNIADSYNVSKKTVNRVLMRANELDISWPLDESDTDAVLAEKFFPSANQVTSNKRMPDYAYIRKELLRNGVSKKLLWTEYMEDCRANGDEPLMYSQFCYHMEACKQYFNTKYVRLPDLLIDLEMARTDGSYKKVMAKYANPVVLILDEWLLLKPTDSEQRDIFELLHRRRKKSSTIFCSQYEFEEWYDQLGGDDSPLADAIIDRIAHDSYRINITNIDAEHDRSMREVYGLDKTLRE